MKKKQKRKDNKKEDKFEIILKALEEIKKLLQHTIAIQLYSAGATQDQIAKNLKVTKPTINKMVKGIKKEKVKTANGKSKIKPKNT